MIDHIFLDMDGVLVDFSGRVAEDWGVEPETLNCWGIWGPLGCTEQEFWDWLAARPSKWWANLCPYPWAKELYELCTQIAPVTFATSPARSGACLSGKQEWLQKMFGKSIWQHFQMGVQKELLAKPNRVLIDDADKNITKFQSAGGMAITFPRPWNLDSNLNETAFAHTCYQLGVLRESYSACNMKAECVAMPEPRRAIAKHIEMDMSYFGRPSMTIECDILNWN